MSPLRPTGLAYWSSGGGVIGRCGPLGGCALELFRFYGREALARHDRGDAAGVRCCLVLALELAAAIVAAADWRRAASAGSSQQARIERLRHLTLQVNRAR